MGAPNGEGNNIPSSYNLMFSRSSTYLRGDSRFRMGHNQIAYMREERKKTETYVPEERVTNLSVAITVTLLVARILIYEII